MNNIKTLGIFAGKVLLVLVLYKLLLQPLATSNAATAKFAPSV